MEIKRKDTRHMVIHTKEKAKIHVKGISKTKEREKKIETAGKGQEISKETDKKTGVKESYGKQQMIKTAPVIKKNQKQIKTDTGRKEGGFPYGQNRQHPDLKTAVKRTGRKESDSSKPPCLAKVSYAVGISQKKKQAQRKQVVSNNRVEEPVREVIKIKNKIQGQTVFNTKEETVSYPFVQELHADTLIKQNSAAKKGQRLYQQQTLRKKEEQIKKISSWKLVKGKIRREAIGKETVENRTNGDKKESYQEMSQYLDSSKHKDDNSIKNRILLKLSNQGKVFHMIRASGSDSKNKKLNQSKSPFVTEKTKIQTTLVSVKDKNKKEKDYKIIDTPKKLNAGIRVYLKKNSDYKRSPPKIEIRIKKAAVENAIRKKADRKSIKYVKTEDKNSINWQNLEQKKSSGKQEQRQEDKKENPEKQKSGSTVRSKEETICCDTASAACLKKKREKRKGNHASNLLKMTGAMGTRKVLEQIEGGEGLSDSYLVINSLTKPVKSVADSGRNFYQKQTLRRTEKKIKKATADKIKEKTAKGEKEKRTHATEKVATEENKKQKKAPKEAVRETQRNTKRGTEKTSFVKKSMAGVKGKKRHDIRAVSASPVKKNAMGIVAAFLSVFLLIALLALPVISVLAVIYNSPFAILFPSISSAETTQEVLAAYREEFNQEVDREMNNISGYNACTRVYLGAEAGEIPDNFSDILAVYMVKYGNGDTATDMTDRAKQNLKQVFDAMCSYSVSSRIQVVTDADGNVITAYAIKYVTITMKTYQDMIPVYGFGAEEQEMLAELMAPENLAMMNP